MKKLLITLTLLLPLCLNAQTTVTVVYANGTTTQTLVDASGEIYFGIDYMAMLPSASSSDLTVIQMDEIDKVLFDGTANIVDLDGETTLSVSPNPTATWFTLSGLGSEPQTVTIYSLDGARMMEGSYADGEHIDVSTLPTGIYLVRADSVIVKLIKR